MPTKTLKNTRRYDLDWLRIIAFGLLIFYHIGMFYVSWEWHVKSVYAGPVIEPFMRLLNPWRLPLLFFISGVALRFAFDKAALNQRGIARFTLFRTWRLFLPLLFGIHIIIAPQSWLQLLETGEINQGFWSFYPEYLHGTSDKYSVTIPTWNHLWYVVYLMLYTLGLVPFAKAISKFMSSQGAAFTKHIFSSKRGVLYVLLIPVLPHIVFRSVLGQYFPITHDVVTDWANHAHSFTYLLTGYILAKDEAFWSVISQGLNQFLFISIGLGLILTFTWLNWEQVSKTTILLWAARFGRVIYVWVVILALLSQAQKWLNKPSAQLTYMTEAIFPWYILHQTLTIMAGYWLTRQTLPMALECFGLVVATFGGCLIIHEIFIRRLKWVRPFFGLRINPRPRS